MKVCFKCNEEKPRAEFYKHKGMADGLLGKCKQCARSDVRENRKANADHYKRYEKARANNPDRVAARKEYSRTPRGKAAHKRATQKQRRLNPLKYAARNMVNNAIRDGKLFREPCEECGETKTHAHHDDYAKPLNIRWLCAACHSAWHSENGEGLNG